MPRVVVYATEARYLPAVAMMDLKNSSVCTGTRELQQYGGSGSMGRVAQSTPATTLSGGGGGNAGNAVSSGPSTDTSGSGNGESRTEAVPDTGRCIERSLVRSKLSTGLHRTILLLPTLNTLSGDSCSSSENTRSDNGEWGCPTL